MSYYIGVDVGTGSARACLIDETGEIIAQDALEIQRWEPKLHHINQSSENIWKCICHCVQAVTKDIDILKVKGIAYDATCSLVVLNGRGESVPVGPDFSNANQDTILWMDHRAPSQTARIKSTGHPLLRYVGGQMSIEMEIPKIMWLKENMPQHMWQDTQFYDLSDFLTDKSTGINSRSFCSVTCKLGYVPIGVDGSTTGWNKEFLVSLGLEDLCANDFSRMGGVEGKNGAYFSAGDPVGRLTEKSAKELGLHTDVVVGSGVIDAYSGWIGTIASKTPQLPTHPITSRLALVAGTSTCHIVMSDEAVFVPGVWGPYRDALVRGKWCGEGGQSTTGQLLAWLTSTHPASAELNELSVKTGKNKFELLNRRLHDLASAEDLQHIALLAKNMFWYGDLYGNRSPIADPNMRGSITGLSMDSSLNDLAIQYLACLEFICQQTKQIVQAMNAAGHSVEYLYLSGGQCRNEILTSLLATCTDMPVIIPYYIDSAVVLGTAMLAARAATNHPLFDVMEQLSRPGTVVFPSQDVQLRALLEAKYKIFLDQIETQQSYRKQIAEALGN